jgi:4-diphosphocytidyl-2-C-methyl-D-erythritol kinase
MRILAPAKINLFLCVTGIRADGYHELFTLMCLIDLYDVLGLEFVDAGITVRCNAPNVPNDEANLAHQAAVLFFKTLSKKPKTENPAQHPGGVSISIDKKIPVAAGLGGGSSNAATVLQQLNRQFNYPFSEAEMRAMGMRIGADVPFFLFQKPALARGIGEKLERYDGLGVQQILLVCPDISVSTKTIYKKLNLGLTKCEKKLRCFHFDRPAFNADQHLCNDLEAVTSSEYSEILDIKAKLLDLGARGALMTGSGPAVFGIFSNSEKVRQAYEALAHNRRWRLYITKTLI